VKSKLFSAIAGGSIKDGVISGVSVITAGEAKGHGVFIDRKSLETFLSAAQNRQGGVPVKMDHGTGFYHIVGKLENFRIDGDSLRADLHLLKTHEQFARIVEMADTMADSFGLSVSSVTSNEKIKGSEYIRCDELNSVDLVDCPAANPTGLFREPPSVDSPSVNMADANTLLSKIKSVFVETDNVELSTATTKVTELSTKVTELTSKIQELDKQVAANAATLSAKDKEITDLKAAQSDFEAKVEKAASAKATELLAATGLPKPIITKPSESPASPAPEKRDFKAEIKPLSAQQRLALERK
jgi:hypothetical protein